MGSYFRAAGFALPTPAFLETVPVQVGLAEPGAHYHVPLLVSPWSYATYRGQRATLRGCPGTAATIYVPEGALPRPEPVPSTTSYRATSSATAAPRRKAALPHGARICVQFVRNYEEGGESSILHGDGASEAFLSEIVGAKPGRASGT